jgi:ribonucrease Y
MSFLGKLSGIFQQPQKGKVQKEQKGKPEIKKVKPPKPAKPSQKSLKAGKRILAEVKAQAKEIILEAKDEAFRLKQKADSEIRSQQVEISRKQGALEEQQKALQHKQNKLSQEFKKVEDIKQKQLEKLERAASLTTKEAKDLILKATEKKLTEDIAVKIKEAEENIKQEADERAREILVDAMYRGATDYVSEYTVSTVKLPDEDMKGRIIGREGRNIRAFEKATGVDVDLDEEGVIRLSSFDSVRREVARVALEKLISDGRIQPTRIEEVVAQTRKDIDRVIFKAGEELVHKVKVYNLPLDIIKVLGKFKYRFSYGQNMIAHTLEETKIGLHLAHEIGANVNVVRLGCLLHDIGKVITEEEGSHVEIGVDFLKKHNMPRQVVDCVAQHHEDEPFTSLEAILVYISDAISGSRPGARYADYKGYVERLEKLEKLANSFDGVAEAYAIQAGREVRVIVNPDKLSDAACIKLAKDLRDKIQKELTYPGQVKVNVIREVRTSEVAK